MQPAHSSCPTSELRQQTRTVVQGVVQTADPRVMELLPCLVSKLYNLPLYAKARRLSTQGLVYYLAAVLNAGSMQTWCSNPITAQGTFSSTLPDRLNRYRSSSSARMLARDVDSRFRHDASSSIASRVL